MTILPHYLLDPFFAVFNDKINYNLSSIFAGMQCFQSNLSIENALLIRHVANY